MKEAAFGRVEAKYMERLTGSFPLLFSGRGDSGRSQQHGHHP